MKKLILFTVLLMFALQSMAFAAASSSKGAPRSAPRAPSVSKPAAPAATTTTPPATNSAAPGYKPSAPASSYGDKAPAAAAKPAVQQQAPQSTGSSFLRTAAMIGGGMLLGGMLGNMFGFGSSGMMAQILGILINVFIVFLLFMVGRYFWTKYKESKEKKEAHRWS